MSMILTSSTLHLVDSAGYVYAIGYNDNGMIGDDTNIAKTSFVPIAVTIKYNPLYVSGKHIVVVGQDHKMYGW